MFNKINDHVQEHRDLYIGFAVGVFAMYLVANRSAQTEINESFNNSFNAIIFPRHSRSIAVRDPETLIPYGSIGQASSELGRSREYIKNNFEILGEVA